MQGTVIQRGTSWSVVLDLGRDAVTKRRLRSWHSGYPTKKDAEAARVELLHQRASGTYVDPSKETLAAFLERWLRDYVATSVAPSARLRYERIVHTQIIPQLGAIPLQEVRAQHVLAAQHHWRTRGRLAPPTRAGTPLSPQTVRHHHRVLDEAFAQAVKWGDLVRNPMQGVDPPRVDRHEARTLDVAEARAWLAYVAEREHGLLLHTAFYTGMRLGELLGLRWRDVDLDQGLIHVTQQYDKVAKAFRDTKSHRGRRPIALPEVLVERLRAARQEHLALLSAHPDLWKRRLVFEHPLGVPMRGDQVRRAHYRYLADLGVPKVGLHELRHTHATHLLHGGTDLNTVAARLGHASPAFTASVYGHLLPGADRAAVERLADRFAPASEAQSIQVLAADFDDARESGIGGAD
jgi:integrase